LPNAGALLLPKLADVQLAVGDATSALAVLAEAKAIREQLGTLRTAPGAKLLQRAGSIQLSQGDAKAALASLTDAQRILLGEGTAPDPKTLCPLLGEVASAQSALGNATAALEALDEAKCIYQQSESLETDAGIELLERIGVLQLAHGNASAALVSFTDAQRILLGRDAASDSSGLLCPLLEQIANAHSALGNVTAAFEALGEAKCIYEQTATLETEAGIKLLERISALQHAQGKA